MTSSNYMVSNQTVLAMVKLPGTPRLTRLNSMWQC